MVKSMWHWINFRIVFATSLQCTYAFSISYNFYTNVIYTYYSIIHYVNMIIYMIIYWWIYIYIYLLTLSFLYIVYDILCLSYIVHINYIIIHVSIYSSMNLLFYVSIHPSIDLWKAWSPQAERNEWWWASTIETWCTYYTSATFGAIHLFCLFLLDIYLNVAFTKTDSLEYFVYENWCIYIPCILHVTMAACHFVPMVQCTNLRWIGPTTQATVG